MRFETAKTQADCAQAYAFALKIFQSQTAMPRYDTFKSVLWKADPTAIPKNLILALDGKNRLVGMARIVPRVMFRGAKKISVAGLSTICLDPAYRGKGHSVPLMRHVLAACKDREFGMALLFARRAADHYYTRFGFWGVSSYNCALLKTAKTGPFPFTYKLTPCNTKLTTVYQNAYQRCYGQTFGRMERTRSYWDFLIQRISYLEGSRFRTIERQGRPIGYVVTQGDSIQELAYLSNDFSWPALAAVLFPKIRPPQLSLIIPSEHILLNHLEDTDCTLSFRECRYGGHMVKILKGNAPRSFSETLRLLGIDPLHRASAGSDRPYTFNVSPLDEF